MARRNITFKKHRRSFASKRRKTRAINTPNTVMRGGIRL